MQGTITDFDEAAGMGWLESPDGIRWFFHCTQIADGTRTVAVGTSVGFERLPYLGRYEATAIRTLPVPCP